MMFQAPGLQQQISYRLCILDMRIIWIPSSCIYDSAIVLVYISYILCQVQWSNPHFSPPASQVYRKEVVVIQQPG